MSTAPVTIDVGIYVAIHAPGYGTYQVVDTHPNGAVVVPVDDMDMAPTGPAIVLPFDLFVDPELWEQVG